MLKIMKIGATVFKIARYTLLFFAILFSIVWIYLLTPQGSEKVRSMIQSSLQESTGWHVTIESIQAIPPFWIQLHNIDIFFSPSDECSRALPAADIDSVSLQKQYGLLHISTFEMIPLLLDLPFRRLSIVYAAAQQIELTLPEKDVQFEKRVLPVIRSAAALPHNKQKHIYFDKIQILQQLYDALPCTVDLFFGRFTFSSISFSSANTPTVPFFSNITISTCFVSIDPHETQIKGKIVYIPHDAELTHYITQLACCFFIEGGYEKKGSDQGSSVCTAGCTLSIQLPIHEQKKRVLLPKKTFSTVELASTFEVKNRFLVTGKWAIATSPSIDTRFFANNSYIFSCLSKSFGTVAISNDMKGVIQIENMRFHVDCDEQNLSVPPNPAFYEKKNLFLEKKFYRSTFSPQEQTPLCEYEVELNNSTITWHSNEVSSFSFEQPHQAMQDSWKIGYIFSEISLRSQLRKQQAQRQHVEQQQREKQENAFHTHGAKETKSIQKLFSWIGSIETSFTHQLCQKNSPFAFFSTPIANCLATAHSPHKKSSTTISSITMSSVIEMYHRHDLGQYTKEKIGFFDGHICRVSNESLYYDGTITLDTPFVVAKAELGMAKEQNSYIYPTADIAFSLPSLHTLEAFLPWKLQGAISCLLSCQLQRNSNLSSFRKWQCQTALLSMSDCSFENKFHVGSLAVGLYHDTHSICSNIYTATAVVKNTTLSTPSCWIDISKITGEYNAKTHDIILNNSYQKGSQHNIPYEISTKGAIKQTQGDDAFSTIFEGSFATQGYVGQEALDAQLSMSFLPYHSSNLAEKSTQVLPPSLPSQPSCFSLPAATISCHGTIGLLGTFSLSALTKNWDTHHAVLQSSFHNIPSYFATQVLCLPYTSSGNMEGSVNVVTYKGATNARYKLHASLSWLESILADNALEIESCGGIENLRAFMTSTIYSAGDKKEPLQVCVVCPLIQKTSTFPFIDIPCDAPIQGSIKGRCDLLCAIAPWMEEEEWAEGTVYIRSTLSGTLDNYSFAGEVGIQHGKLDILALGGVVSNVTIHGTIHDKDIYIDDLTATDDKKGSIRGTANIFLPIFKVRPLSWNAHLFCSQVEIINLEYAKAAVTGDISLSGTSERLLIDGKAETDLAVIDVAKRFTVPVPDLPVVYAQRNDEEKTVYLDEKKNTFMLYLNLSLTTKTPLKIKGRGLHSAWQGHALVTGSTDKPHLDGTFSTKDGTFVFAGKEFNISHGSVTFGGDDIIHASRLNVAASTYLPGGISTRLLLRGTIDAPHVSLQSNPTRTEKEILSLILFNKELNDISPLESLQLATTAMSLDQNAAPLKFIDAFKKTMGIDKIEISSSKNQTLTNNVSIRLGKSLTPGVMVNISKNISGEANRIGLELALAQNISAEAEIGDDSEGIISIKWKKEF